MAQKMVTALEAHDATTARGLLCSSDPVTSQLAAAGLPITRSWLAIDGLSYAGSTRRDLVYRVQGVPNARALGVDVITTTTGNWCVMKLEINPPGQY